MQQRGQLIWRGRGAAREGTAEGECATTEGAADVEGRGAAREGTAEGERAATEGTADLEEGGLQKREQQEEGCCNRGGS